MKLIKWIKRDHFIEFYIVVQLNPYGLSCASWGAKAPQLVPWLGIHTNFSFVLGIILLFE